MDELLKEDPSKRLKTTLWTLAVVVLAFLSIVSTLCFYLNFVGWFKYNANKEEIDRQLSLARQELAFRKAEQEKNYASMMQRLDDDYNVKKKELVGQINRYLERFQSMTNLLEGIIAERQQRLDGLVAKLEKMPDVEMRFSEQTNALASAISQRDAALQEARNAQDSYSVWNGKIGAAKASIAELEGRKRAVEDIIAGLDEDKAELVADIAKMAAEKKSLADELNGVKSAIESNKVALVSLSEQMARIKKDAEAALSEKESALDKMREAQSLRDRAMFEKEQEEKAAKTRKQELHASIEELKSILQEMQQKKSSQLPSYPENAASNGSENK